MAPPAAATSPTWLTSGEVGEVRSGLRVGREGAVSGGSWHGTVSTDRCSLKSCWPFYGDWCQMVNTHIRTSQ